MEIVINTCFGGFGLSHEAIMKYSHLAKLNLLAVQKDSSLIPYHYYLDGIEEDEFYWSEYDIKRDDPDLVRVVKQLGSGANGFAAELKVVSIPDDVKWHIDEYDGIEHVAEDHRTWR
jgi:hypothetical protein